MERLRYWMDVRGCARPLACGTRGEQTDGSGRSGTGLPNCAQEDGDVVKRCRRRSLMQGCLVALRVLTRLCSTCIAGSVVVSKGFLCVGRRMQSCPAQTCNAPTSDLVDHPLQPLTPSDFATSLAQSAHFRSLCYCFIAYYVTHFTLRAFAYNSTHPIPSSCSCCCLVFVSESYSPLGAKLTSILLCM